MTRSNYWALFSLASLILVSSAGQVVRSQTTERSIPITSARVAPATQAGSIAQSMRVAKATVVKSGNFTSGEHPTQGMARIVRQDGKLFLEFDRGFATSDKGPDLVVLLHRSSDVFGSGNPPSYPLKSEDYLLLAPLQKFTGAQRYAIPASVNLANYQSAVIWCRKFNATFGAAKLISQ